MKILRDRIFYKTCPGFRLNIFTVFNKRNFTAVLLALFLIVTLPPPHIFAQTDPGSGVAVLVDVKDVNVQDGQLISSTQEGYKISRSAYDPSLFGVVTDIPAVSLEDPSSRFTNPKYVLYSGKAYVQVTAFNGEIKVGDPLTSSEIAGAAQKASNNGFLLGTALEAYANSNPRTPGKILVSLDPDFSSQIFAARANLIENFRRLLSAPYLTPLEALRYIMAALTILISIGIGIWFFGRVSSRGVEAVGRNPLAGRLILSSVFLNVIITVVVVGVGILVAYLILIL